MKRWILLASLLLKSCGGDAVPKEGFADIKYGMSAKELKKAGFTCSSESACSADSPTVKLSTDFSFSKPDHVTANLTNGAVSSIDLIFLMYNEDETIASYTKAYGEPTICRYQNPLAATIERHVWSASSGATITVSKVLDYGVFSSLGGLTQGTSSATYRDANESKDFKSHSC